MLAKPIMSPVPLTITIGEVSWSASALLGYLSEREMLAILILPLVLITASGSATAIPGRMSHTRWV